MTFKEVMERTGEYRFNFVKSLVKDALAEIEQITKENVDLQETALEKDKQRYEIPNYVIRLNSVKVYNSENDKYYPIKRIRPTNIVEDIGEIGLA